MSDKEAKKKEIILNVLKKTVPELIEKYHEQITGPSGYISAVLKIWDHEKKASEQNEQFNKEINIIVGKISNLCCEEGKTNTKFRKTALLIELNQIIERGKIIKEQNTKDNNSEQSDFDNFIYEKVILASKNKLLENSGNDKDFMLEHENFMHELIAKTDKEIEDKKLKLKALEKVAEAQEQISSSSSSKNPNALKETFENEIKKEQQKQEEPEQETSINDDTSSVNTSSSSSSKTKKNKKQSNQSKKGYSTFQGSKKKKGKKKGGTNMKIPNNKKTKKRIKKKSKQKSFKSRYLIGL